MTKQHRDVEDASANTNPNPNTNTNANANANANGNVKNQKGVMGKLKSKLSTTFGKKKNEPEPQRSVHSALSSPSAGGAKKNLSSGSTHNSGSTANKFAAAIDSSKRQQSDGRLEEEQVTQDITKQTQAQQQPETAVEEFCADSSADQEDYVPKPEDNDEIVKGHDNSPPLRRQSWDAKQERDTRDEEEQEEDEEDRVKVFEDSKAAIAAIEKAFASTESLLIVGRAPQEVDKPGKNEPDSRSGSFESNNREEIPISSPATSAIAPEADSPAVSEGLDAPVSPVKRRMGSRPPKACQGFAIPVVDEQNPPTEVAVVQEIQSLSPRKAPPPRKRIGANTNEMPILASASCILQALEDERNLLARQTEATMKHDPPTLTHWQTSSRRSNEKLQIITEETEADNERDTEEEEEKQGAVASAATQHNDVLSSKAPQEEEQEEIRVERDQAQEQEAADTYSASQAAAIITDQLGDRIARLLGADPWGDRQDGFDALQYFVKKSDLANAPQRKEILAACVAAVHRGVDDRVAPVMYCALDCLVTVLKQFAPILDDQFAVFKPLNQQLHGLFKSLLAKLNDTNKRTQREATQAILRLARLKKLKTMSYCLVQLDVKDCSVLPRYKMEFLLRLLQQNGLDPSEGLSADYLMRHALVALRIAEEKTRKAAVELIAALHVLNCDLVNCHLVGVKPEMLRVIHRRVDELLAATSGTSNGKESKQNTNQKEDQCEKQEEQAARDLLLSIPNEDWKVLTKIMDVHMALATSVIGPVIVRKLESKTWSDRKEALAELGKHIVESKSELRDVGKPSFGGTVQQHFVIYCIVIYKLLNDSIAPVVNGAMDCFVTLIKVYGTKVEWRQEEVQEMILQTLMRLFHSMQKPNNRTNRAACRCVLKVARLPSNHALRCVLSCVFSNNPDRPCDPLVQMHLLKLLIPEFGFSQEGISASLVLEAVAVALAHGNDKVRKAAIDVALCTQRVVGKDFVLKKLKDVKQVTLKELEKSFVQPTEEKSVTSVTTTCNNDIRPHSVHVAGASLPPVNLDAANARRLLASAPVGIGSLQCTPLGEETRREEEDDCICTATTSLVSERRASVLSNEEENLMDSILEDH